MPGDQSLGPLPTVQAQIRHRKTTLFATKSFIRNVIKSEEVHHSPIKMEIVQLIRIYKSTIVVWSSSP